MHKTIEVAAPVLERLEAAVLKARLSATDWELMLHLDGARDAIRAVTIRYEEDSDGALTDEDARSLEIAARHLDGIHVPESVSRDAHGWAKELRSLI